MIITAIIERNTSFPGPRLGVEIQSFLEQERTSRKHTFSTQIQKGRFDI